MTHQRLLIEFASLVLTQKFLDEAADLPSSRRVELLAGIDELVAHAAIEPQNKLSVFLAFLTPLAALAGVLGHGRRCRNDLVTLSIKNDPAGTRCRQGPVA